MLCKQAGRGVEVRALSQSDRGQCDPNKGESLSLQARYKTIPC